MLIPLDMTGYSYTSHFIIWHLSLHVLLQGDAGAAGPAGNNHIVLWCVVD